MANKSERRAEAARINGAKSRGPTTKAGLYRSQTASLDHGLYAVRNYTMPGESTFEFAEIRAHLHEYWGPRSFYEEQLIETLTGIIWESKRIQAAKNDQLHDDRVAVAKSAPRLRDAAKLNLEAEKLACVRGSRVDYADVRLGRLALRQERIERQMARLEKRPRIQGGSQMSLKINARQNPEIPETADANPLDGTISELPYIVEVNDPTPAPPFPEPPPMPDPEPEPDPAPESDSPSDAADPCPPPVDPAVLLAAAPDAAAWAQAALNFTPDPNQVRIISAAHSRVLVLAPRQSGKSSAAAVRVLWESLKNPGAVCLLASASSRQSNQIMEKARDFARIAGVSLFPPPPKCDGFSLSNGAKVIALPDSQETIRGFSAPRLIIVDEAAFASRELFRALEPMLTVSRGTLMLLSTPNGQTGYFYEQWHRGGDAWLRIFSSIEECPRVDPKIIEEMRITMGSQAFEQEVECRFVAASGQFISREAFRKCIRNDFPLFLPDYDNARRKDRK